MKKFLAFALVLATSTAALAADISYSLQLTQGGEVVDPAAAAAGEYTLEVWGTTVDNEIFTDTYGGILQFAVELEAEGGIEFVEGTSGPIFAPVPSGAWDSTIANSSVYPSHFQGVLDAEGNVVAETGAMPPGNFDANFASVGANVLTLLTSGPIVYDGNGGTITVSGNPAGQSLYADQGGSSFGGVSPTAVIGSSLVLGGVIPEPSTAILAGLALVGFAARRNG